jgi:hypothetical protein
LRAVVGTKQGQKLSREVSQGGRALAVASRVELEPGVGTGEEATGAVVGEANEAATGELVVVEACEAEPVTATSEAVAGAGKAVDTAKKAVAVAEPTAAGVSKPVEETVLGDLIAETTGSSTSLTSGCSGSQTTNDPLLTRCKSNNVTFKKRNT